MPSLDELQQMLWTSIVEPLGVSAAKPRLAEQHPGAEQLTSWVLADDEDEALERLSVYANAYFFRIRDSLKEDFQATHKLLGELSFNRLVAAYLVEHPSRYPSLGEVGQHLPEFSCRHEASRGHAFLPDLMRLERARFELFDAADAKPLTMERLSELPMQSWQDLWLELVPAHRRLDLRYDLDALWKALVVADRKPNDAEQPEQRPTHVLVWRRGYQVIHRRVLPEEQTLIELLQDGVSLPDLGQRLCESLSGTENQEQEAAHQLQQYLRSWVQAELLREL